MSKDKESQKDVYQHTINQNNIIVYLHIIRIHSLLKFEPSSFGQCN